MSQPIQNAIELRDLTIAFGEGSNRVNALNSVNLAVKPGSVFGFLGPNGAGKTTAIHVLLGFVAPTNGKALMFGSDVRKSLARERIGFLSENASTYRFLTGRELLTFTGHLFGLNGTSLKEHIDSTLEQVDLVDCARRRISTYSRGMLQRICLAQALINNPDLVILDEPTNGLDPVGRIRIRRIVENLKSTGKTVFFSSHELSEVETVCDQIAILSEGRILASGRIDQLVGKEQNLEKYFLKTIGAYPNSNDND